MDNKIRLGIIGIGNMGSAHAKSVMEGKCPDFVLTAVSDLKEERQAWAKETLGEDVAFFYSAEEMLDSGLIDACIVSVPHYDHPRLAMACMERGIHVMVEKPAGVYTKQVEEMNAFAAKHPDVVFAMMFNQRTNHVYRKMKELVSSGKYGNIRRTNWIVTTWYRSQAYYDSGAWRATWAGEGGGVLLNQCPHQLDLWQWICGMPVKVDAKLHYGKWHDIEVEDDVSAYVEYENGATGVFVTSTGDASGTNRFEVQMDGCQIIVENDKLILNEYENLITEHYKIAEDKRSGPKITRIEPETDGLFEQHPGVINAWGGAILRGEPLIAHGSEGINGLTISNAMHLSSWLGKPVELPIDKDLYYEELKKRIATSRLKTDVQEQAIELPSTF